MTIRLKRSNFKSLGVGGFPISIFKRFYTIFDPGYVDLVTPWVPSGDFEIEASILTSATARQVIFDDAEGVSGGILLNFRVENTGYLQLLVGDGIQWRVLLFGTTTLINDGQPHTVKATKVGSLYSIFVDGVLENSISTSATVYPQVQQIGAIGTGISNIFNGIIYNVSLKDLDTPSNSRYYPLDTDSLTIARETLNADGAELVVNGDFSDGLTNWTVLNDAGASFVTVNASNQLVFNYDSADNTFLNLSQANSSFVGANKVIVNVESISGTLKVQDLDTNSLYGTISTPGSHEFVGFQDTPDLVIGRDTAGEDVNAVINSISMRETTDALYIDVQAEDKIEELP